MGNPPALFLGTIYELRGFSMLKGIISVQVNEESENSQRSLVLSNSSQPPNTMIESRVFICKSKLNRRGFGGDFIGGMKVILKASAGIKQTLR